MIDGIPVTGPSIFTKRTLLGATPWLDGFHGSESGNVTSMIRMINDINRGSFFFGNLHGHGLLRWEWKTQ